MATIRVVLVRPESAANVGASARALRNAGLAGLDLVQPAEWRTVECWRTAWGAQDVLEQARVFPDLPAALAESTYAAAFTGRQDPGVALADVRELAEEIGGLGADEVVALVFGPETSGLTLAELAACGRRVRIPAHGAQPSLNLSHAVMVAAYEVHRARSRVPPRPRAATWAETQAMLSLLKDGLLAIGALPPRDTNRLFREWEQMLVRAGLTPKEVRLLEHMARKMHRAGHPAAEGGHS